MGEDKSSLRLRGKTLLQHMEKILAKAGCTTVYISAATHIADEIPGSGPLSGVHAVLHQLGARHSHFLFAPVDMPGLTPCLMRGLIDAPPAHALVRYDASRMPFRLRADTRCFALAERMLREAKDVSLGHFQAALGDRLVLAAEQPHAAAFVNINTTDEWRVFRQKAQV